MSPPVVNLSSSSSSSSSSSNSSSSELLLKNLQRYGWSPISIDNLMIVLDDDDEKEEASQILLLPPTRQDILNIFQNNIELQQAKNKYTYRSSGESGGIQQDVEPKESLEVKLSDASVAFAAASTTNREGADCNNNDNNNDCNIHKVDQWCFGLSKIAHIVNDCLLEMPSNTMLVDENNNKNNTDENASSSLDLMRVFYYHSTPTQQQLGSSPHTDWGSWTIVWQDSVGGLETYCRKTNLWIPVEPPSSSISQEGVVNESSTTSTTTWNCIVHVGDMASLALTRKEEEESSSSDNKQLNDDDTDDTDDTDEYYYCWPSPKHRVLTSTTTSRVSLVYFGYPPANTSIRNMQSNLQKNWKYYQCRIGGGGSGGKRLPLLKDYYLLQDQSSTTTPSTPSSAAASTSSITAATDEEDINDNKEVLAYYKSIESMSIQEIIQEKWNQVQRTSY